ncbi:MAG: hypothetical protein R3E48_23190 [Burkholderiaceae bacterium]
MLVEIDQSGDLVESLTRQVVARPGWTFRHLGPHAGPGQLFALGADLDAAGFVEARCVSWGDLDGGDEQHDSSKGRQPLPFC